MFFQLFQVNCYFQKKLPLVNDFNFINSVNGKYSAVNSFFATRARRALLYAMPSPLAPDPIRVQSGVWCLL